jgi:hypothetical protein
LSYTGVRYVYVWLSRSSSLRCGCFVSVYHETTHTSSSHPNLFRQAPQNLRGTTRNVDCRKCIYAFHITLIHIPNARIYSPSMTLLLPSSGLRKSFVSHPLPLREGSGRHGNGRITIECYFSISSSMTVPPISLRYAGRLSWLLDMPNIPFS